MTNYPINNNEICFRKNVIAYTNFIHILAITTHFTRKLALPQDNNTSAAVNIKIQYIHIYKNAKKNASELHHNDHFA